MKRAYFRGGRLGGLLRGPRALYAVAPLFIPLIFATVAREEKQPLAAPPAPREYLPIKYTTTEAPAPLPLQTLCLRVSPGDTLEKIFAAGGLRREEAHVLAREFGKSVDPRKLRLGDPVRFEVKNENVEAVEMKITGWGAVRATRNAGSFEVTPVAAQERREETFVDTAVDSSLYQAVRRAGETPQLVASLVEVFQWDVDFFRLRKGDWFRVVVEKKFVGDDHVGYGPVVAAQFHHNGRTFEAFRHEQNGVAGYYARNGNPIKKQFLRSPLKFSRITSGFTHKRFHPILNRFRPHYGVDYGAPTGTPVMSTADGVVVFAGYDRGEGNFVRVRHNSRVETSYLHLSKFAAGVKKGTKVEQGDVIGYVGATGYATGPHLDYRVSDAGKWLNPQELKSITADPLRGEALRRFKQQIARYEVRMPQQVQLATKADDKPTRALF